MKRSLAALVLILAVSVDVPASAALDDFSNTNGWLPAPIFAWSHTQISPRLFCYQADIKNAEAISRKTNLQLSTSWTLDVDLEFENIYASGSAASLVLLPAGGGVQLELNIEQKTNAYVLFDAGWFNAANSTWYSALPPSDWMPAPGKAYHLRLSRFPGTDFVDYTASTASGFSFHTHTVPLSTSFLDAMKVVGLRAVNTKVTFSSLSIATPVPCFDLTRLTLFAGEGCRLKLLASPGQSLIIEGSADLLNWAPIIEFYDLPGSIEFLDPAASNSTRRFYRLVPLN